MAGIQIPGGYGPYPGGYTNPYSQDQQRPKMPKYRQDAGSNMTDEQYTQWQNSRSGGLAGMQQKTNIGTDAQKALAEQQAQFGLQRETHGAKLQSEAEQRRMAMFSPYLDKLMGQFSSSMTSGGGAGGGNLPPRVQQVDFGAISGAEDAARAAAFARAKDQAGQVARSAMTGLSNAMGARGLGRSRYSGGAAANIINQGANQLGEVTREQQIQDYNRAAQRASEHYQGQISQRGQDVSMRGQDISAQLERQRMMQQALQGIAGQFPGQITARY